MERKEEIVSKCNRKFARLLLVVGDSEIDVEADDFNFLLCRLFPLAGF